jgi:glycosyltransferase involved in cell wall biosynthesis
MRVAINGMLLGNRDSGVHRCIRGLARGLDLLDVPDEFFLFTGYRYDPQGWRPERVKVRRSNVPSHLRPARIFYDQVCFPLIARLRRMDLIHGPAYIIPSYGPTPAVVTVHDLIALRYPELCKRSNVKHYELLVPRSVGRARKVIVLSNAVKRDLVSLLRTPEEKIAVVPPGIDECFRPAPEDMKAAVRATYGLPERFVLFVGNIEPKKNLETLIRVFFAARLNKNLDHKLVIVGQKGWKYEGVFSLVKSLDFQEQVVFTDYVPLEDLPAVYSLAGCFVFPSIVEGFGLPPLEAMACGTPVVTSDDPALLEATGDAALHAPGQDKNALREAIERVLLVQSVQRRLREAGLARAAQFTWKRSAELTLEVYRDALKSGAAAGMRPD